MVLDIVVVVLIDVVLIFVLLLLSCHHLLLLVMYKFIMFGGGVVWSSHFGSEFSTDSSEAAVVTVKRISEGVRDTLLRWRSQRN